MLEIAKKRNVGGRFKSRANYMAEKYSSAMFMCVCGWGGVGGIPRREVTESREATQRVGESASVRNREETQRPGQIQPHGQLLGREVIESREATRGIGQSGNVRNATARPDSIPSPTTWPGSDRIKRRYQTPRSGRTQRSYPRSRGIWKC